MRKRAIPLLAVGVMVWAASAKVEARDSNGDHDGESNRVVVGSVENFATLPEIINSTTGLPEGHPEGLCADSAGNVYADSFEQPIGGPGGTYVQNYIYKFGPNGHLISATPTANGVVPLGCIVSGNKFYMNDVYNGDEYQYTLPLTASSTPTKVFHVCGGFTGMPGAPCGLNANAVGPDGRVYITDNGSGLFGIFVGNIYVLDPRTATGNATVFLSPSMSALYATALNIIQIPASQGGPSFVPNGSVLPYSANGITFSNDGSALYFANMSTNVIWKQPVTSCNSAGGCQPEGDIEQFSHDPLNFIQGPDNISFDNNGNLWVASGQQQHVVALDRHGDVVGVFGAFHGIDSNGAPIGLLQPSGVIFANGNIYIGNESNDGGNGGPSNALLPNTFYVDWTALKKFTISRVKADLLQTNRRRHSDEDADPGW
ncbi:MAG: SMP-30/gluconolactonase/LRE family protein [Acidobacteriaceae bacterium]|nr:SMP-30/gluconolactonase/LRE family protein [Acidobacteriaceae bacterium]